MQSTTETSHSQEAQQPWFRIYSEDPERAGRDTRHDTLADLSALLETSDLRGLVLYMAPAAALAMPLAQGTSVAQALAGWSADCEAVLAMQRKYRSKLVVMECPATDAARTAAQRALAGQIPGMALPQADLLSESDLAGYRDFAALALGQDARALVDGLQAASLGPYDDLPAAAPLIEALVSDWHHQETEIKHARRLAPLLAAQARAAAQKPTQSPASKQKEAVMAKQIIDLEQTLRNVQATLDEVYASTSWRILEPVRAIVRRIRR